MPNKERNFQNIDKVINRESSSKKSKKREKRNEGFFSIFKRLFPGIKFRWSLLLPALILTSYSLVSIGKLFSLSVIQNRFYTEKAAGQHMRRTVVYPERGRIIDSKGKVLATTVYIYTIGITPRDVRSIIGAKEASIDNICDNVANILSLDRDELMQSFKNTDATYIQLKKGVDRETKTKLEEYLDKYVIGGFAIDPVAKRYYPEKDYLSTVIGFTSTQDQNPSGILGVEYSYNNDLTGEPGYSYTQVDNFLQSQLPNAKSATVSAKDGNDVVLTINEELQRETEEVVSWMSDATNPERGAMAIVMDPKTGEILAMAGANRFDLNNPSACPPNKNPNTWDPNTNEEDLNYLMSEIWRNKVISEPYEPGSIMKPFTLSIAFDEGQVSLDELLSDAPIQMGDWNLYPMKCWADNIYGFNHGLETIQDALMRSCNPPFAILAQRVGISNFYDYVKRLGFTENTGIDLPAESVGLIHSNPSITDLCTISIGEQSTVSMIRMATIYSALANGGKIIKPHVVKRVQSRDGTVIRENTPEVVRHVFSESITAQVRQMMIPGTHFPEGSGPRLYGSGLLSAGKTGTSLDNEDNNKVCYSSALITPYDYPDFIVLCASLVPRADTDSKIMQLGARLIARKASEIFKQKARFDEYDIGRVFDSAYLQDYSGLSYFQAVSDAAINRDIQVIAPEGTAHNEIITEQFPTSGVPVSSDSKIYVGTAKHPIPDEWKRSVEVPNFIGLTYFEAKQLAANSGLNLALSGYDPDSAVSYQSIMNKDSNGKVNTVQKGTIISLIFDGEALPSPDVGLNVEIWRENPTVSATTNENETDIDADEAWRRFDSDIEEIETASNSNMNNSADGSSNLDSEIQELQ